MLGLRSAVSEISKNTIFEHGGCFFLMLGLRSAELIRTDPNTDGQQRKQTKQIQKLSNVNFLLENCSGKSIFDKVQLSTGAMPKSSVTFPSTNG